MTFSDYQIEARKTAIYPKSGEVEGLMYAALGLAGEAGELSNHIKKMWRDGALDPVQQEGMRKEVGDILWYVAQVATELGVDLEEAAQANVQKLRSRMERGVIGGSGDNR